MARYPTALVDLESLERLLIWLDVHDDLLPADPDLSAAIDELKANANGDLSNVA